MKKYEITTKVKFTVFVNDEDEIESEVVNTLNIIDAEDTGWIEYEECD